MQNKRLKKSSTNKIIFGVCGGLEDYFGIDAVLFRVIFLFLLLFGGTGAILYLVMAVVMPTQEQENIPPKDAAKQNAESLGKDIKDGIDKVSSQLESRKDDGHIILGAILLILGGYFLLSNFGFGLPFNLLKLWPAIIIALGIYFLIRKR